MPVIGDMLRGLGPGLSSAQANATPRPRRRGPLGELDPVRRGRFGHVGCCCRSAGGKSGSGTGAKPWPVAMAVGSISWYAIIAVRIWFSRTAANWPDGRRHSCSSRPGYIAALAVMRLVHGCAGGMRGERAAAGRSASRGGTLMLMFNGLANGWPPYWERLPGPYRVAAYERSVEPEEVASADLGADGARAGQPVRDRRRRPTRVLGSYGDQNPIGDDDYLYTSPRLHRRPPRSRSRLSPSGMCSSICGSASSCPLRPVLPGRSERRRRTPGRCRGQSQPSSTTCLASPACTTPGTSSSMTSEGSAYYGP